MDFLLALLIALVCFFAGAATSALIIVWRAMRLDAIDMATTIDTLREQLRVKRGADR